jgi:hypothetical protein
MSSNKEVAAEALLPSSSFLDAIPDGIPFDVPYGPPISLDQAGKEELIQISGIGQTVFCPRCRFLLMWSVTIPRSTRVHKHTRNCAFIVYRFVRTSDA